MNYKSRTIFGMETGFSGPRKSKGAVGAESGSLAP